MNQEKKTFKKEISKFTFMQDIWQTVQETGRFFLYPGELTLVHILCFH